MKIKKLLGVLFAGLFVTLTAFANQDDEKSIVTVNQSFRIPGAQYTDGQTYLPAGEYVFKIAATISSRDIVMVYDVTEQHLAATVISRPDEERSPSDFVKYQNATDGGPILLVQWTYPGSQYTHKFVGDK